MPNNLMLEGLSIAPNVIETIVRIATENVEGVASVGGAPLTGAAALLKAKLPGVEIRKDKDDVLTAAVHVTAVYGAKLPELGSAVQTAVADALASQLGIERISIDVYIDALEFVA